MKKLLVLVIAVLAATGAATADGQKGGPLTVLNGGRGVVAPDGRIRYVALTTGNDITLVSFVRVEGGQVLGWRQLRGYFGIPQVAQDGTTDGISRDGRTLVLASPAGAGSPRARQSTTQFAMLDTKSLRLRRLTLPGTWAYDAISPDASVLYLVEYVNYGTRPTYRVRAYDVSARRLLSRPIVDGDIGERLMRGWAVTRATTRGGRWAYTLYARGGANPFVHALDTTQRRAYCIDLPLDLNWPEQLALRLRLQGERLEIRRAGEAVASIDVGSFVVHSH